MPQDGGSRCSAWSKVLMAFVAGSDAWPKVIGCCGSGAWPKVLLVFLFGPDAWPKVLVVFFCEPDALLGAFRFNAAACGQTRKQTHRDT